MTNEEKIMVSEAKEAAVKVLDHNSHGVSRKLPRTAGWGYPEPYTRDMMIASLGVFLTKDITLINSINNCLITLAENQSALGHIPSLVNDPDDRGSSDCTPLFLMAVGIYRKMFNLPDYLDDAVKRSLTWLRYQNPSSRVLVAQLPTTDWRDEQWVLGYGLFVNTVTYIALRLLEISDRAKILKNEMHRFTVTPETLSRHIHAGLVMKRKPYYALWSYKIYSSHRFDLLGNSLAIISGIASRKRARSIIAWVEAECYALRSKELLSLDLPPNFFPYINPGDPDWIERYRSHNAPGTYHNGGVWPFICGFYIAACVAAGKYKLAEKKLIALTKLVKIVRNHEVDYGFNEWFNAIDGSCQGQDWQSWSAAMYIYAAVCVEDRVTPFFDEIRNNSLGFGHSKKSTKK